MALLGAQLVITLVMVSIIQKLGTYLSLAKWLLCSTGLVRFLYPTNTTLKQLANIPKEKSKHKRNGKYHDNGKEETFQIPRSLSVELETSKINHIDIVHLRYYSDYQWLVDFSVYAIIVYIITEVYLTWFPLKNEINLSILWCTLVLLFAIKILSSLTIQYFKSDESLGERSTCIVMGCAYFFISMIVLITDENTLELGLEPAFESFKKNASVFLSKQGLSSSGPASKIVVNFFFAVWCGIMGALFTFPGFRIAKMHWDLLKYFRENKFLQILLNLSFALPFLLVIAWVKPVSRNYLTVRVFSGMNKPLLETETFESLRLFAVVFTVLLKIFLMPWYLQTYLNIAHERVEKQKKEAGRITNVDFQKKIAAVFYYLCVVTLQYVAPLIICLFFTFILKTLGGYSWSGLFSKSAEECPISDEEQIINSTSIVRDSVQNIFNSTKEFHMAIENLKMIFTPVVFRGLFGFATWWSCFLYFSTTSVGLIYQTYFSQA